MRDKMFDKTVDFIKNQQQRDGSFLSMSSSDAKSFSLPKSSPTIFLTSLILSSLASIPETQKLKKIKQKALVFLLSQKSAHWSFNYWKKESDKAKVLPYPDDLDDTFCALSAIYQTDPKALDAGALAKIVTLLTAVEEKEGGPYYTWMVPPDADKAWRDVDLAVNSNVAYFLALQDVFLPGLQKIVCDKIEQNDLHSKYYPTVFPVVYFLSHYLSLDKKISTTVKNELRQKILSNQHQNGSWGNILNTALAVSSLLRLGIVPKMLTRNIEMLKQEILKNNWQAYAFCCDPVIQKKQYYAGSSALTAALSLEALSLFDTYSKNQSLSTMNKGQKEDKRAQKIYDAVVKLVKQRFASLGVDLKQHALAVLEKTLASDKDKQIILMPYFFTTSLGKDVTKIKPSFLISLGLANVYGWMAYRIYDDFFDGDGKPVHLSVANVCLRELTTIYNGIIPEKFQEIMDMLDSANGWEVAHTRFSPKNGLPKTIPNFKNFSQLVNKSLGHALGPLAILIKMGYSQNSKEVKNFLAFFKHYIIARQLNDDAHDWEEDLARGQINAVGAMVLTETKDKSKLREVFWQEVIQEACRTILQHIQEAKAILDKSSLIKNKSPLLFLLAPIEKSAQIALAEQKEALEFMSEYGK